MSDWYDSDVERDFQAAEAECERQGYSDESLSILERVIEKWTQDARFLSGEPLEIRTQTLNQLTFLLAHPRLDSVARRSLREIAARTTESNENGMRVSMVISTFELAAEPPEDQRMLSFLFSMESDPLPAGLFLMLTSVDPDALKNI